VIFLLEKTVEVGILFDYYGKLLTEKQQKTIRLYYHHDLSMGEIATKVDISRQGVYDHLNRGEKLLRDYEKEMNLIKKYHQFKNKLDQIVNYINDEAGLKEEERQRLDKDLEELKKFL
jgi:predicted DNA-binding protein YlxM (UPF0122 family)